MGQPGFFDLDERYQRLSESGDPLVKLAALIDFEAFRPKLATALKRSDGSKGGRPPYDPVLMFKILILQTLYTLSDDATEFQIRDRLSFMRFLGLGFEDAVPDAKTVWLFREQLTRAGSIEELFAAFDAWLKGKGYLAMSGQIIDASIIAAPRQRNTDAEKAALKEGLIPEAWAAKPKKLAQKDRDARWTLKRAKARPAKADGSKARSRSPSRCSGTRCMSRSTGSTGSSAASLSPARPPMTGRNWPTFSIRPTRRATSGPTPPTARRRMKLISPSMAGARRSTSGDSPATI